jgi:hypothetical protein
MQNTSMLKSATTIVPGLVSSYTKSEQTNQFENDAPYLVKKTSLAQVQYSTVEDLLKFDNAIFNYKLLSKTQQN